MERLPPKSALICVLATLIFLIGPARSPGETMLQYFNTSWRELTLKMPEIAEAGYTSLWLPPPTKGGGGFSVGYDVFDRFDLGSKDQKGTIPTRYGSEAELFEMIEAAHRHGIRVYFDNVMNHNGFDTPGFTMSTPDDLYPGFLPADFHLRVQPDGTYRLWDNIRSFGDEWQVLNLNLSGLIDIANEPQANNANFGPNEGDNATAKPDFVRQPNNPEYYCFDPSGTYVGFGPGNGLTTTILANNPSFYSEKVEEFLNRWNRWFLEHTKADGFRLDAVKHTPFDFFGATGAGKDIDGYGFLGQAQEQFNLSRGFSDPNHRDTVFNTDAPRNDAMMFGEHLGEPPPYGGYIDAGMRLIDNPLRNEFNNRLGNPSSDLFGFDSPGAGGFAPGVGVMHAQSHDNDFASARELQHCFYFTREGLGLVYTDGNHHAGVLEGAGGAFPRHANTNYLGQFADPRLPNLAQINDNFGRGSQEGNWSDADLVVYTRLDKRKNPAMSNADGATMSVLVNDNFTEGQFPNAQGRSTNTSFNPGAYLWQYARGPAAAGDSMFGFFITLGDNGAGRGTFPADLIVPRGGYYIFSWRNPQPRPEFSPIEIRQSGIPVGTLSYERMDGPDGDPDFNPFGVPGDTPNDFKYTATIPRVTDLGDLDFLVTTDGSADRIMIKLNGGIDVNSHLGLGPQSGELRDHPPGTSDDIHVGYEDMNLAHRVKEKFAAIDTGARNTIGSPGAETYIVTVGTAGFTVNNGGGPNGYGGTATHHYHDPNASNAEGSLPQFSPAPENATGQPVTIYSETGTHDATDKVFLYYTIDGSTFPEGIAGEGLDATQVVEMIAGTPAGSGNIWWSATLPALPSGTELRYKIGAFQTDSNDVFPGSADNVAIADRMVTRSSVEGFDGQNLTWYPHNDLGETRTGPLPEGFHLVRARAFLERPNGSDIYNTFTQSFYVDTQRPQGEIVFPSSNGQTVGGNQYGFVVRTDSSVTGVCYKIDDSEPTNDDSATGFEHGNNAWVEATEVTPDSGVSSSFPREWRFDYYNIPPSGNATIRVRLKEPSSSGDNTKTDVAGHYTTLIRTVNTAGPADRMFVRFPARNLAVIDSDYVMKVYFSKALAVGTTTQQLLDRFEVKIGPEALPFVGTVYDSTSSQINYDVDSNYHELAIDMPNLFNGLVDFVHRVEINHDRPDPNIDISTFRRVKAAVDYPELEISDPAENGGSPAVISLPDVPMPTALDRQYIVKVLAEEETVAMDLDLTIGAGSVTPPSGPITTSNGLLWEFTVDGLMEGPYRFTATATGPGGATQIDLRDAEVMFEKPPLDTRAFLEGVTISIVNNTAEISFPTVEGYIYTIRSSTDLVNWANEDDPGAVDFVAGPGTSSTFVDNQVDPKKYYQFIIVQP